ncbi:hypothetical protein D030_4677B, partial [Vibrio parahaemolyticus AQ3810]
RGMSRRSLAKES